MNAGPNSLNRFGILGALAIALGGLVVVLPFAHFGVPSGHDFEFHFNSWTEVTDNWHHWLIYPHWAALAHFGYGEARFIFYPPLSWILGAALGMILPWKLVPAAYIWVAIVLSGVSMFLLARRWFSRADALFAAMFYAANPYHLVIVYWRSALAELLAAACFPFLLLLALRSEEEGPRVIAPLSLLLGTAWLTNVPSAVMMNYSLALLFLWIAWRRRSVLPLAYGTVAVVLGATIAAVYLVPAWHQQSWANLSEVLSPGYRPEDNFLFAITPDLDHNRFNRVVSLVAVWELALLAGAFSLSRRARQGLWWPLLLWSAVCGILMSSFTHPLWAHLPELRLLQFPWRWLLCLNVALALGLVLALRRMALRILVCCIAFGSVVLGWHSLMRPWWDTAADIQEMVDNQHDNIGYDGTDEYVPATVDSTDVDQNAPRVRFDGKGPAKIQIVKWRAEEREIVADASSPGRLVLRLFNYPCWRVEVNGRAVQSGTTPRTGLMVIPVAAGESRLQVRWVEGWDRTVGGVISILALLGTGILRLRQRSPSLKTES